MAIDAPAIVVKPSSAAIRPIDQKNQCHVEHDSYPPAVDVAKAVPCGVIR